MLWQLAAASEKILQPALLSAWTNVAPRRLATKTAPAISPALRRAYDRYLKMALRLLPRDEKSALKLVRIRN